MRAITKQSVEAFMDAKNFKSGNTKVLKTPCGHINFYLHDNMIATFDQDKNELFISTCGWRTNTTKERLNAILQEFNLPTIYQKNWEWFFTDGEDFDRETRVFKLK